MIETEQPADFQLPAWITEVLDIPVDKKNDPTAGIIWKVILTTAISYLFG